MNKRKNFLVVFSFLVVLVGSLVFSGCETSRVGPEVPRPNPTAPAAQAIVLSSYVLDGSTGNGIPNAVVSLVKLDGSVVTTSVTNASGLFSFNLTALNLTETTYNVSTNVSGYGYGFRVASYDKANNTAGASPIVLTKIVTTTTTIAATGGTAATNPTNEAKTTTQVSVTLPANAVPAGTQVAVAAVPIVSTPPPTIGAATQSLVASTTVSAPGVTTFASAVTMSFTLPFPVVAGTQIPVLVLNTATNKWEDSGLKAVVSASGLTATVQITKPGQYALLGDLKVSLVSSGKVVANDGLSVTKLEKVISTKDVVIDIFPNSTAYTYTSPTDPSPFITVLVGTSIQIPNNAYIYGLIQQKYGDNIANSIGSHFTFEYVYNLPTQLRGSDGVLFDTRSASNVIIGPPGHTTESGDWVFRITITETLINTIYNENYNNGFWNLNITAPTYRVAGATQWVWRQHNQGTAGLAGYNP